MNYRLLRFAIVFSGLLSIQVVAQMNAQQPVIITEEANGKKMVVRQGAEVEVRLSAQLGTGYSWSLSKKPNPLQPLGEPTVQSSEGKRVGGTQIQNFRFVAAGTGTAVLAFSYSRSWQKESSPVRTFKVTISVID